MLFHLRRFQLALFVAAFTLTVPSSRAADSSQPDSANPGKALTQTLDVSGLGASASACTDFYQYADASWLEKHPIPSDRPRWGSSDELNQRNENDLHEILERLASNRTAAPGSEEQKLGDFYGACMDEAAIEAKGTTPLAPELERIAAIHDLASLRAEIGRLHSLGANVLFAFGSEEDRKDASRMIAAAVQAGLGLPERDYYLKKDAKSQELRQKYTAHVAKMLELAGASRARAEADARKILALETRLAEASQNNVDIRDPAKTHHPMTVEALANATPNLDWKGYFRDQNVTTEVAVNVWQPDFFQAANRLLRSEPLTTWKAYLRWHLISAAAPALPKRFVDENFDFNGKTLAGVPELRTRWKRCVAATDAGIGMALGHLYVNEHFPPSAKKRADELVDNLLAALADDIKTLTWMGDATKQAALAKVAAMGKKIGYPDKWRDYSSLEISRDSHLTNYLAANQYEWRRDLAKIGKPVDRTEWGMTPPTVNAYNASARNEIVFSAGILQPPFFYPEGDDAINYGAIGGVIGHEITHGFDNSGRKFDAKGNQTDWWTAQDAKNFDERAACIISQFDGYSVEPGVNQKGALVQGEAIADLGGLTIAYRAYRKTLEGKPEPALIDGLTADQRFFTAYARIWASNHRPEFARLLAATNEHPLGKFRAIGTVSNMPEFARAFSCDSGSAMVRAMRCQIW